MLGILTNVLFWVMWVLSEASLLIAILIQDFFLPSFITSAFSAPTFTFSNGTLSAEAVSWFPKPSVSWLNQTENILNGSSTFTENSEGIFSIFSTLLSVQVSDTYSFRIENNLVMSLSEATISGSLYTFTLTWYQTHLY